MDKKRRKQEILTSEQIICRLFATSYGNPDFCDVKVRIYNEEDQNDETIHFEFLLHSFVLQQVELFKKMLLSNMKESTRVEKGENGMLFFVIKLHLFNPNKGTNYYSVFDMFFKSLYGISIPSLKYQEFILPLHYLSHITLTETMEEKCNIIMLHSVNTSNAIDICCYLWNYRVKGEIITDFKKLENEISSSIYDTLVKAIQCIRIHIMDSETRMIEEWTKLPFSVIVSFLIKSSEIVANIDQKKTLIDLYKDFLSKNIIKKADNDLFTELKESFLKEYKKVLNEKPYPHIMKFTKIIEISEQTIEFLVSHYYLELRLIFYISSIEDKDRLNIDYTSTAKKTLDEENPIITIYIITKEVTDIFEITTYMTTSSRQCICKLDAKRLFKKSDNVKEFGVVVSIKTDKKRRGNK